MLLIINLRYDMLMHNWTQDNLTENQIRAIRNMRSFLNWTQDIPTTRR